MNITELKTAQIVALYNSQIEGGKEVKKFATRAIAEKRIADLLQFRNLMIATDEAGTPYLTDAVDPKEDAEPVANVAAAAIAKASLKDQIAAAKAAREAAKKTAKPAKAKTVGGKRGPAPEFSDDAIITEVVANPKKAGSASAKRFAAYKAGMTVAAALKAGVTRADLRWDADKKFVKIG